MADLRQELTKCFQTVFVGAVSHCEEQFGHLWQEGSPEAGRYYQSFRQFRLAVLDQGNHHLRKVLSLLEHHGQGDH